jgi:hypothetical protein
MWHKRICDAASGENLSKEVSTTFPGRSIETAKFRCKAIPIARPDAVVTARGFYLVVYSVDQVRYWWVF